MRKLQSILFLLALPIIGSAYAQAPTGTIAGVVRDPSGAVVAGAQVKLVSRATGLTRAANTSEEGDYSFLSLMAGEYLVSTEAQGFRRIVRQATVEAGATTTTDLELVVGDTKESITVDGASPQMHYDSYTVGGLITQSQIQDLPLNGRSLLELAKLEPGVQPPTRGTSNRTFVPALGQPVGNSGRGTRVTIDGGSIMAVGNGGSAMGLSQEVVEEFQISTVGFDLSTGITDGAAINVVTRSGGNDLHGSGFYFFRDHKLAAYPALNRDLTNPDPFFQRRQFGFALGGPIRRDRIFFFVNWERNEQRGVVATTLSGDFANLSRITPSPYFGNQLSLRLDGRLSNAHTAFIRYSHDGVRAFGPPAFQPNAYPSSWLNQPAWADQSILGLTSVFRETLVNDFRFSYFYISSSQAEATERECPACLGIGAPSITVPKDGLFIGRPAIQQNLGRRFHLNDFVTWQRGTHRARFGVDWEHNRGGLLIWNNDPATLALFSPDQVRIYNKSAQTPPQLRIPLPSAFNTLSDILQLPLQTVMVGIGDPRVAQENGSLVRTWNTARLFFQDTWRLNSRLNLNYGLGWSIDRNLNYDLTKPALLAPILGADGLGPTRKQWKNFSPVLGLAWSPWRDGKTVFRTGAGIFYDFLFNPIILDIERALVGPPGSGRQNYSGTSISNCLPGIPGVPVGRFLNFPDPNPTLFTGANLLACLPMIRAGIIQKLANADPSIQAIQLSKQASGLNPADVPSSSAVHVNLGVQREIARDLVVNADFAYRHFIHLGLGQIDLNHFNSAHPVIPKCLTIAQRDDTKALCSTGPINVQTSAGNATYKGLLLRAEKRFSHGFQVLGSWAYSSNTGTNTGNGFNRDDWLSNRGPLVTDFTHIVNLAGVTRLPWQFQLGLNFSYSSAPAFSAFLGGIDLNGDGTTGDLLPGTTVNAFNRGMGRADLKRLVAQFNQTNADTVDSKGAPLMLPDRYRFGDNFHSLDLRLNRSFRFRERWHLLLIAEAFNLYNAANLSDYSGDLTRDAFGQPTSRVTQVFGSGGPRAFQLGARISF
ncbi:MAG TPA: carboxypeptidase regulatory-like domain-containing protein [Blastocatellia bacterium]|nr:carboxypeptidase regulatory-like domain-containing protein [Blastocatellia bacterium]